MKAKLLLILFLLLMGGWPAHAQYLGTGNITTSGTSCAATPAACVSTPIAQDIGSVAITLTGTWSGTLQFEVSQDGVNFVAVSAYPPGSTTAVTSTTSNGTWTIGVSSMVAFHVRASALASGTATVTITGSKAVSASSLTGAGGGGPPTGAAGGVLSGTYPNPGPSVAGIFDQSVSSASDWSLQAQANFSVLPTANKNAYATGAHYTSTQTSSVNPFANIGATETAIYYQLPCQAINANSSTSAWSMPGNDVVLSGCGIGGDSVLNATGSFPASTPLITFGNGTQLVDGSRLENYRIVCPTGLIGCSVFLGQQLQENSGLNHVVGIGGNLPSGAVDEFTVYGAHATYQDVASNYTGTGANAMTVAGLGNKISRFTGNNTGKLTGNSCIYLQTSTFESADFSDNIHCEGFVNAFEVGANVSGILNGIDSSGTMTDVVHLDSGGSSGGFCAEGIVDVGTSTNLVNDLSYATPRTFPSAAYSFGSHHFLGLYCNGTVAVGGFNGESPVYSGNHTLTSNEYNVSFSATATATVNVSYVGQLWNVFNRGSGTVTVACSSGTINGAATLSIPPNAGVSEVTSDGTNCWGNQFLSSAVSAVTASGFLASSGGLTPAITVAHAQGTDTNLLTSGTVSGAAGVFFCTDSNGGATTSGCPGTGTGTVNAANQYQSYFQLSSGSVATAAGNPNIVTDASNDLIDQTVVASAVASSPFIEGCGVYEVTSGPTYGSDCWGWQTVVGGGVNGTTTYQLLHESGSSGAKIVEFGSPSQGQTYQFAGNIEGVAQGNSITIQAGLPGTNASAYGSLGLTAAAISGGSAAGTAGSVTVFGASDASTSATSSAGNAILAAGSATAGGIQGSAAIEEVFTVAAALSQTFEVVDMTTTADRAEAAILGSTVVIGIAQTVGGTGTTIGVITHGKSTVRFDGTPVIGDVACGPPTVTGTAGLAHDNGSTACTLGTGLGVVTGQVSGTGSGATATVLLR